MFPDRLDLIGGGEESCWPSQESQYQKIPIRSHHLPNIIVFRNVTLNTKEKVWRCKKGDVGADYEGLSWRHYPDGWRGWESLVVHCSLLTKTSLCSVHCGKYPLVRSMRSRDRNLESLVDTHSCIYGRKIVDVYWV